MEIKTLNQKDSFIINKAKTFEEEKEVADKVPIQEIKIKNISINSESSDKIKVFK